MKETTKEMIIRKLTSRKLWTAAAGFIAMLIVALGGAEQTATQVTALIMSGASLIAYIIGEGMTDAAHAGDVTVETVEEQTDETERRIGF